MRDVANETPTGIPGIRMLQSLAFAAVATLAIGGVAHAAEGEGMEAANVRVDDIASLQRGSRLFFNYCSGCHSLQYLRFSRIAEDLKLDEKDVANNLVFTGAKIGDKASNNMPAPLATGWFGKAPPDLSLEARAKGSDWIYNYLKSFYVDASRPVGWNNKVFPNVSMPNALWSSRESRGRPKPRPGKATDQHPPAARQGLANCRSTRPARPNPNRTHRAGAD